MNNIKTYDNREKFKEKIVENTSAKNA